MPRSGAGRSSRRQAGQDTQWADRCGLKKGTLAKRLRSGMPLAEALRRNTLLLPKAKSDAQHVCQQQGERRTDDVEGNVREKFARHERPLGHEIPLKRGLSPVCPGSDATANTAWPETASKLADRGALSVSGEGFESWQNISLNPVFVARTPTQDRINHVPLHAAEEQWKSSIQILRDVHMIFCSGSSSLEETRRSIEHDRGVVPNLRQSDGTGGGRSLHDVPNITFSPASPLTSEMTP